MEFHQSTVAQMDKEKVQNNLIIDLDQANQLELVTIPKGRFLMGSTAASHEGPIRPVNIPAFLMGKFAVTQKQWRIVAGDFDWSETVLPPEPSFFKGNQHPVERITWYEAVEFCNRLTLKFGRTFRLPTEAEWEYACRAGSTNSFFFDETKEAIGDYAWYNENSGHHTHPVGQKLPNPWGLYDIVGNAWEWCQDRWHRTYDGAPNDNSPWLEDSVNEGRLLRGASWNAFPGACRSTPRNRMLPSYRAFYYGLRVVCEL